MHIDSPLDSCNRRGFLSGASAGLAGLVLARLLGLETPVAAAGSAEAATSGATKAKRVIRIFLPGGLSQVDSFDYKPELARWHGKPMVAGERPDVFFGQVGLLHKNFWEFRQRGESGLWISDLFPHLAGVADELTVIRSMFAETSNHTPAAFQAHTGFRLNGFPSMGSWLAYGLGSETDELPAFVVLPDVRGLPAGGSINWSNGFLPAEHQGVTLKTRGPAIHDLTPGRPISAATETASRRLLEEMNRRHLEERGQNDDLRARIRGYELAAKMQLAVPEVADLDQETQATHSLYGLGEAATDDFGRQCLLARRLLERGVRFVQLFAGGAFPSPRINWDGHEDVVANHGQEALRCDRPVAGLLRDLKQRGMLEDTLVMFVTEFGRTPFSQSADGVLGTGRDHNQNGFSVWLAGAGLKKGYAHGATDDFGYKSVEQPVHWHDLHATVLRLLGIDHEQLTYYHNGIQRRLTNVHGHVVPELLA